MSLRSDWSIVFFKAAVFLLICCLNDVFIVKSGILKFVTIIVSLFISLLCSVSICFIYLSAPVLGA